MHILQEACSSFQRQQHFDSTRATISFTSVNCKQRLTCVMNRVTLMVICTDRLPDCEDIMAFMFSLHCLWWHRVWQLYAERLEASEVTAAEEWRVWVLEHVTQRVSFARLHPPKLCQASSWCIAQKWVTVVEASVTILQASVRATSVRPLGLSVKIPYM